jgi:hypothetical protein
MTPWVLSWSTTSWVTVPVLNSQRSQSAGALDEHDADTMAPLLDAASPVCGARSPLIGPRARGSTSSPNAAPRLSTPGPSKGLDRRGMPGTSLQTRARRLARRRCTAGRLWVADDQAAAGRGDVVPASSFFTARRQAVRLTVNVPASFATACRHFASSRVTTGCVHRSFVTIPSVWRSANVSIAAR